jgi:hypothetical protein
MTVHCLLFTRHFLFRRTFLLRKRRGEGVGVPVPEGRYPHLLLAGWGILFFAQASSASGRCSGVWGTLEQSAEFQRLPLPRCDGSWGSTEPGKWLVGYGSLLRLSWLAGSGSRKLKPPEDHVSPWGAGFRPPNPQSVMKSATLCAAIGYALRPCCQRAVHRFAIARRTG